MSRLTEITYQVVLTRVSDPLTWPSLGVLLTGGSWLYNPADPHLWYIAFAGFMGGGVFIWFGMKIYQEYSTLKNDYQILSRRLKEFEDARRD